jgi:putative NADH-flavin reductase
MATIVIFGATGKRGGRLLEEALSRGHQAVAVVKSTIKPDSAAAGATATVGGSTSPDTVRTIAADFAFVLAPVAGKRDEAVATSRPFPQEAQ